MTYSEIIRNLRLENNLTQVQVAKAIGILERAYQTLERGQTKDPRMSTLIALADFFDVSLDYLVGRSDKR